MFRVTPGVRWLLIANAVVFVLYFLAARTEFAALFMQLALSPRAVLTQFALWQLVTYMFLHSPLGFGHILINMLSLWMFGGPLEDTWGTRRFLHFYFFCGIGAGVCVVLLNALTGSMNTRTIGASGAVYGVLIAFAVLFPRAIIYLFMMFPIEARWFVLILGAIVFLSAIGDTGGGVSHFAHLGGLLFGYLWLRIYGKVRPARSAARAGVLASLGQRYREWKLQRAKKRFQVYLKKHGASRDSGPDDVLH
ncbi:MAG: rhomboid family intramembrane serine protease [Bryobacteraceae bacterium]